MRRSLKGPRVRIITKFSAVRVLNKWILTEKFKIVSRIQCLGGFAVHTPKKFAMLQKQSWLGTTVEAINARS